MVKLPYWRLSGFYFFYFASLGVLVPYWALYLKSLGFSALQIGIVRGMLAGKTGVVQDFDAKGGIKVLVGKLAIRMDAEDVVKQ